MLNKKVAKKYNVPKNTLSTWVKNKEEILKANKAGHAKRQRLKQQNLRTLIQQNINSFYQSDVKMSLPLDLWNKTKFWNMQKSLTLPTFKHPTDNAEVERKSKLTLHHTVSL